MAENLADFLHAMKAQPSAWEDLRDFVYCLRLETSMRFTRWPELLRRIFETVMQAEFDGEEPGDATVLRRLTADTLDLPLALRYYCDWGEWCLYLSNLVPPAAVTDGLYACS